MRSEGLLIQKGISLSCSGLECFLGGNTQELGHIFGWWSAYAKKYFAWFIQKTIDFFVFLLYNGIKVKERSKYEFTSRIK